MSISGEPPKPAARPLPVQEAEQIASAIMTGFALFRVDFAQSTHEAGELFHEADWHGIQNLGAHRLAAYQRHLQTLIKRLGQQMPNTSETQTAALWREIKVCYSALLSKRYDAELGATFYNSAYRRLNPGVTLPADELFVEPPPAPALPPLAQPLFRTYEPQGDTVDMMRRMLGDLPLRLPWQDFDRDIRDLLRSLPEERPEITSPANLRIHMLTSVFYRNKGAYAVGKIEQDGRSWPIAMPLLQDDLGQLYVDTLICDADELSIMFSFTRAYFLVDTPFPAALVDFLHDLLPNKKRSELYNSIGLNKHGKTEFYRSFAAHLSESADPFIIAPGIKGMVMAVFTLPSYEVAFKIIKDRFAPQKNITKAQVQEKYTMVKRHDRVGRMADTQEFRDLALPLARFDQELLDHLLEVAPSTVSIHNDQVLISHVYIERMMTPLNLYVETANEHELTEALDEYGNAIKQLAAANIFPGDMLLKNFGVTRHARVVFYDYDEICYLTEVNFRTIPEPRTPEEEMSADVWYSVGPDDVFPEEFRKFLFGRRAVKAQFQKMHGELFEASYWAGLQSDINAGEIKDVFPYRRKRRFTEQRT
ncbi:MAG: bifunctional isocitrate dehydrogenase kinase/phosphatase [Pseudomonadales bacterium]